MIIQLTDKIRISSEPFNYILQYKKIHQETKKEYWVNKGYYPNWDCIVEVLLETQILESDAKKLSDISKLVKKTKNEIFEYVKDVERK